MRGHHVLTKGLRGDLRGRRRGFTLTELLLVVGILAVLVAILLPAIGKVRESARRAVCLSHIRQLTAATLLYAGDNDRTLPEAAGANSWQSPLSPRGSGLAAWQRHPIWPTYVLPSIGALLEKYLGSDASVWRCPDAPDDPNATDNPFILTGDHPYTGTQPGQEFRPNYYYEAGKEYFFTAALGGPVADQNQLRAWAARNVSGLRIERAVPVAWSSQHVVLFHDRDSAYHSEGHVNIYLNQGDWRYYGNYGYLDGHAEGHDYRNVNEYLAVLHGPIPQQWFGRDFQTTFPEQYAPH